MRCPICKNEINAIPLSSLKWLLDQRIKYLKEAKNYSIEDCTYASIALEEIAEITASIKWDCGHEVRVKS